MNLTGPEHEVTCTDNPAHVWICTCGNPGKHEWRIKQGWSDRCPSCNAEINKSWAAHLKTGPEFYDTIFRAKR
jgi:hypothetical protein